MTKLRFLCSGLLIINIFFMILCTTTASAGTISGRVTTESDGRALQGVAIKVYNRAWSWLYRVYTDSDGFYITQNLRPGKYYLLTTNTAGYIDECYDNISVSATHWPPENIQIITVVKDTPIANIDFKLTMGASISGRVSDAATGAAIENVAVRVVDSNDKTVAGVLSDANGRFVIKGLYSGIFYIKTLNKAGYIDGYFPAAAKREKATALSVSQGTETVDINFELLMGGTISGKMVSKPDGAAVVFDQIHVYDKEWKLVTVSKTDATGRYYVRGLPTGNYYLRAKTTQNFLERYYYNATDNSAAKSINVIQGLETSKVNFELIPGGSISGRVTQASDGKALRDVYIKIYDHNWNYVTGAGLDRQGNYSIQKLPAGRYYVQSSNAQGYIDEYNGNSITREGATPITVDQGAAISNINFRLHQRN